MTLHHDSRDPSFHTPPGPGACLSEITIRLYCHPIPEKAFLRLWWDDREILYPMRPIEDNFLRVTINLPDHPGLLWYYFIVESDGHRLYYGNAADHMGGVGAVSQVEPPAYQITVFDPAYVTPRWMRDGLIYQFSEVPGVQEAEAGGGGDE